MILCRRTPSIPLSQQINTGVALNFLALLCLSMCMLRCNVFSFVFAVVVLLVSFICVLVVVMIINKHFTKVRRDEPLHKNALDKYAFCFIYTTFIYVCAMMSVGQLVDCCMSVTIFSVVYFKRQYVRNDGLSNRLVLLRFI